VKFVLLLFAFGCSAIAAALFLVFQVERGAVDQAVLQYVLAALLAIGLPALVMVLGRTLVRPLRNFGASAMVFALAAIGVGVTLLALLFAR
jgi:hypothetical protein